MQRALLDRLVERGYCLAVGRLGGCLVALLDSLAQSAQRGAQAGGVGAIGGSAFRGLTGAFERRKMISHIAWLPFVCTARYSGEYRIRYSTGLSLDWSNAWAPGLNAIDSHPGAGYALPNGSDLPSGMSIPAGPVSKHNPVFSAKGVGWSVFRAAKHTFLKKT